MIESKTNFWKAFIILIIYFYNANAANICDPNQNCNNCVKCGSSNNYASCYYYNIFCYKTTTYFTTENTYNLYYKNEYIKYFDKDNEIKNFCGKSDYSLDSQQEFTLLNTQEKTFPSKKMHCHYTITKNGETKSPLLEFNMAKNEKVNEDRHLKFQISNIFKYDSGKEESVSYSYSKIQSSPYKYSLDDVKQVEIFIDFGEAGYKQPEEIFQIKVSFESKSNSLAIGIGSAVGGIVALFIFGCIIYACCCKTETYVVKERSCQIF